MRFAVEERSLGSLVCSPAWLCEGYQACCGRQNRILLCGTGPATPVVPDVILPHSQLCFSQVQLAPVTRGWQTLNEKKVFKKFIVFNCVLFEECDEISHCCAWDGSHLFVQCFHVWPLYCPTGPHVTSEG